MLDTVQRPAPASGAPGYIVGSPSITGLGIRALMGRIASRTDVAAPVALPAFDLGLEAGITPAIDTEPTLPERTAGPTLRARAEAAFRTVDGAPERALAEALSVMEAEIAELSGAVRGYGEALKSIGTYAADESIRAAAHDALRAQPQRLAAARPIPKLAQNRMINGELRHG